MPHLNPTRIAPEPRVITPAERKRRRLIAAASVLVGAIILVVVTEWGSLRIPEPPRANAPKTIAPTAAPAPARAEPPRGITGGPTPVRAFGAPQIPPPASEGARSTLADKLNDPQGNAGNDVAIVAELVANYVEIFRKLPVGTNPEITAALAGDNARGLAPLPADHRAINAAGELTDRWGTPFFFHQLARDKVEVRSAGPDRHFRTTDDVIWPEAETTSTPTELAHAEKTR